MGSITQTMMTSPVPITFSFNFGDKRYDVGVEGKPSKNGTRPRVSIRESDQNGHSTEYVITRGTDSRIDYLPEMKRRTIYGEKVFRAGINEAEFNAAKLMNDIIQVQTRENPDYGITETGEALKQAYRNLISLAKNWKY